jgi:hypothetical protein
LTAHLSDPHLWDAIFNSYIYNVHGLLTATVTSPANDNPMHTTSQKTPPAERTTTKAVAVPEQETGNNLSENLYAQHVYLLKISKNHIVEILFVLSTLLSGKRKAEVQGELLRHDFVRSLNALFDEIKWHITPSIVATIVPLS